MYKAFSITFFLGSKVGIYCICHTCLLASSSAVTGLILTKNSAISWDVSFILFVTNGFTLQMVMLGKSK